MRNPNGYGSIIKLKGKRRKPFQVRGPVTGYNEKGQGIFKILGYTETKKEALLLLANSQNPQTLKKCPTFEEVYNLWLFENFEKLGASAQIQTKTVVKHCTELFKTPFNELKTMQMQKILNSKGAGTANAIKTFLRKLDNFALDSEIITEPKTLRLKGLPLPETKRDALTLEELQELKKTLDFLPSQIAFVLCFTGWRINELLQMPKTAINLEEKTMAGGLKTKAGKDRIVPIHPQILPIIEDWLKSPGPFLFVNDYAHFKFLWNKHKKNLKIRQEITFHWCRHTFRSMLDTAGVRDTTINILMGHVAKDIGKRIYTHKRIEELREAILKISYI